MSLSYMPYAFRELNQPSRHKAYYGGRGGAKSHSFAEILILRGYERRKFRWLCAREIQNSLAASVKQLLEDKIRKLKLGPASEGGNGFYKITERSITGGDGQVEFLFAGLRTNPDSVKSMEGLDGAWVEEANTVSQRSIQLLIPTVRKPNSELWWSWNRNCVKDPVDNMFLGGEKPPSTILRKVGWRDNPWFPDVLRTEMEWDKRRDSDKWRNIWEGEPRSHSQSRVFKNWRIGDLDHRLNDHSIARLGADWGFSKDPTVLVCCYILDARTLYIRKECWALHLEVDHTPAFWAGDDWLEYGLPRWENPRGFEGIPEARNRRIIADSSRPEIISYMRKRGFDVLGSRKGPKSIVEGVEFIKSYDVVIHPSCKYVIDEFNHYSYDIDKLTGEILSTYKDKKNHTIDAVRYALEAVRRADKGRTGMTKPEAIHFRED